MPPPAIILLSGGIDSATCLACARRDGFAAHCLSFDYGQRHRHELAAAAAVARQLGAVSHVTVAINLRAIGGSALTADIAVPKDRPDSLGIPVTYVPARNLTFLSIALGHAEVVGATDIFIGVNAVDYSGYPDCRPAFIRAFEATARLATKAGVQGAACKVHTPLIELSKAQIIRLGQDLGVDYSLTHSCYDPLPLRPGGGGGRVLEAGGGDACGSALACGHCDSCLIRKRGFAEAGIPDPTRYA